MKFGRGVPKYYRQQLVEVRSSVEILRTLDAEGKLEGLPFMPEMIAQCGKQIRVHRRADRTCVAGAGFRRMNATVFLQESRCDGSYHDGCQRGCLLFWKEAWLKPARAARPALADSARNESATRALQNLVTRRADRYVCQSTELVDATAGEISRWDARPLMREIMHGELSVRGFLAIAGRAILNRCTGWYRPPVLAGTTEKKSRGDLALRQGEWVKVKSSDEIREQLDPNGNNCGLAFQPTMTMAIGGRFQVAFPIRKIIIEQTGKMVQMNNTVALKGMTCQGPCATNCPRNEYLYWRESWLDRTKQDS
jgi:hypothetical protein